MFAAAQRVEARGVKLLYRANGRPGTRFAVVVARGCGGAVKRNREKRISREAYRSLKDSVVSGFDLVFLVFRFGAQFPERRETMRQLIGRAGLQQQSGLRRQ